MFCSKCHSIMFLKGEVFQCLKCGNSQYPGDEQTIAPTREKKETAVIEEEISTLPRAKVECPSCQHREAFWILKQTRAADEPATRIYICADCGHKWREY